MKFYKNIEDYVCKSYNKIEDFFVGSYKSVDKFVVDTYLNVEESFIKKLFARDCESVADTKRRLSSK